jgi:hypothetical protein
VQVRDGQICGFPESGAFASPQEILEEILDTRLFA